MKLPHYFNLLLRLRTHYYTDHSKQWGFSTASHRTAIQCTPGYLQHFCAVLLTDHLISQVRITNHSRTTTNSQRSTAVSRRHGRQLETKCMQALTGAWKGPKAQGAHKGLWRFVSGANCFLRMLPEELDSMILMGPFQLGLFYDSGAFYLLSKSLWHSVVVDMDMFRQNHKCCHTVRLGMEHLLPWALTSSYTLVPSCSKVTAQNADCPAPRISWGCVLAARGRLAVKPALLQCTLQTSDKVQNNSSANALYMGDSKEHLRTCSYISRFWRLCILLSWLY